MPRKILSREKSLVLCRSTWSIYHKRRIAMRIAKLWPLISSWSSFFIGFWLFFVHIKRLKVNFMNMLRMLLRNELWGQHFLAMCLRNQQVPQKTTYKNVKISKFRIFQENSLRFGGYLYIRKAPTKFGGFLSRQDRTIKVSCKSGYRDCGCPVHHPGSCPFSSPSLGVEVAV